MENYEILRQLGSGTFGKTFEVLNLIKNEKNVLKMISCKDESHANEAFRESNRLLQVDHIYIGTLMETFVHFQDSEITFYLVIVMPFYSGNSCSVTLKENWMNSKILSEELIKQLLVQMVELLSVLDKYGISHLNLKPENIFYNYKNDHVILSDFGLKAILNDRRRYIRSKPSEFIWKFPIDSTDEDLSKLDVWTLGMILFAFMITSVMSESKFLKLLQSTEKYNLDLLRKFIENNYSKDLVDFIISMLNNKVELRPGIKALAALPFFERCFKVYGSHIISRQLRKKINTNLRPIPIDDANEILQYIHLERNNEICVEEALAKFQSMCKHDIVQKLPTDFAKMITDSMDINNVNPTICEMACCSLGYLAMYSTDPEDMIFSRPIIQSIILSLTVHPDNFKLHQFAAAYFIVLSSFHKSSCLVGTLKGLNILVTSLDKFMEKVNVVAILLNAIWNLCVERINRELAIKNNALDILLRIYEKHLKSPVVLLNATASLLAVITSLDVSTNPENIYITYFLLQSLQTHKGYVNLVKYTLVLLENLLAMNEEHALQFLECYSKIESESTPVISGIEVLKTIFETHNDNSSMTLSVCNVVLRLVCYEDLVEVIIDLNLLSELLKAISLRFRNSRRISTCINSIADKIKVQLIYMKIN